MSFGRIQSVTSTSINNIKQWDESVKTQLDLVQSYLSIQEWEPSIKFAQILKDKLQIAIKVKQGLMKLHGITDIKDVIGFRCQVCSVVFPWPTALGGHMSKAHPNHKKMLSNQKLSQFEEERERIKKDEMQYQTTRIYRDESGDQQDEN